MIDALAALAADGTLLISVVHRGSSGPVRVETAIEGFSPSSRAEVRTLTADVPWAANSLKAPDAVKPVDSFVEVRGGRLTLDLKPFTAVRVRIRGSSPN